MILSKNLYRLLTVFLALGSALAAGSQQVTGIWQGKIDRRKVEVKIIQRGDSLTGTSYYYEGPGRYRRFSIRGHFDAADNAVVWWDDALLESRGYDGGMQPLRAHADFNCPGGDEMYLDGGSTTLEEKPRGPVALTKVSRTAFPDEWDYVIDRYTVGANDPEIIDSVALIAYRPTAREPLAPARQEAAPPRPEGMVRIPPPPPARPAAQPLTIEEKFLKREKLVAREIPISGDTLELRFYDNAQVDGDSISLFLDGRLIFSHIRLSDKAYVIRLATKDLPPAAELTMVAENLGAIPPNTSYMVALCGEQRHEAQLASTENSSAVIRFMKQ